MSSTSEGGTDMVQRTPSSEFQLKWLHLTSYTAE